MEFRSPYDLLGWLAEVSATHSGALKRGEYLLSLAHSEGKIPQPPGELAGWFYELRDDGLIVFDDRAALGRDGTLSRKDVHFLSGFAVTAAGRTSLEGRDR